MSENGTADVIAVVPTFSPDSAVLPRLALIAAQVSSLIVVDDGSPSSYRGALEAIAAAGFEVVHTGENRGIAAALNTGIRLALERGAAFVLTVDQDTELGEGYVAACRTAFVHSSSTRLGIVCTDAVNGEPSIPERYTAEGLGIVREAIQSGFLISAECLRECGLFDERLFIDCVDTEYCLRIAARGFSIAVGPGTDIAHALGEQVPFRPFGRQRYRDGQATSYQHHSPVRRYYITRNNIDLFLRYRRANPRWVRSALRREFTPAAKHLIGGPHRLRQAIAAVVGATHGLLRRRGPARAGLRRVLTPR